MLPTDSHMGPSSYAFRGISDLLMSIDLYEVRPSKIANFHVRITGSW